MQYYWHAVVPGGTEPPYDTSFKNSLGTNVLEAIQIFSYIENNLLQNSQKNTNTTLKTGNKQVYINFFYQRTKKIHTQFMNKNTLITSFIYKKSYSKHLSTKCKLVFYAVNINIIPCRSPNFELQFEASRLNIFRTINAG